MGRGTNKREHPTISNIGLTRQRELWILAEQECPCVLQLLRTEKYLNKYFWGPTNLFSLIHKLLYLILQS